MPHQSANYEICLHTLYVTLSDCNIVTLLHCYIFMIHIYRKTRQQWFCPTCNCIIQWWCNRL